MGAAKGAAQGWGSPSHLAHELRADVLVLVCKLDGLGHRHAILGDLGRAEGLFDHHIAALRSQRHLHGASTRRCSRAEVLAGCHPARRGVGYGGAPAPRRQACRHPGASEPEPRHRSARPCPTCYAPRCAARGRRSPSVGVSRAWCKRGARMRGLQGKGWTLLRVRDRAASARTECSRIRRNAVWLDGCSRAAHIFSLFWKVEAVVLAGEG